MIRSNRGVGVLKAGWHCGGTPGGTGTTHDCPTCYTCIGSTCVADNSQTLEPVRGNCQRETCNGGSQSGEFDASDRPEDRDPHDCMRLECQPSRPPYWISDVNETPEQIQGNCRREICPTPGFQPDAGDAPAGMQCCIDDDPVFDDAEPFNPNSQCCTPTGIKPIFPISTVDIIAGACPNIRRRDGFNWPTDPRYDDCTVPPEVLAGLGAIPFYSGDKDNPASVFPDTSFSEGPDSPCFIHDACYYDCTTDHYTALNDCNEQFVLDLYRVCDGAAPERKAACYFFAVLYGTGVSAAGPFFFPGSQQAACQCC